MEEKNSQPIPSEPDMEKLAEQKNRLEKAELSEMRTSPGSKRMFSAVSMYGVAIDFGLAIFIPIILCVLLAKYLAARTGNAWYLPVGAVLAVAISTVSIYRQIITLKKKMKP